MARNVPVQRTGHMSLPIDSDVVHQISTLFSQLDEQGSVIRAGVTSIGL
jgi:hypothetical protein